MAYKIKIVKLPGETKPMDVGLWTGVFVNGSLRAVVANTAMANIIRDTYEQLLNPECDPADGEPALTPQVDLI